MEPEHLQVLEQHTAVSVNDRLGKAGGPAGVKDPQRVAERDAHEAQLLCGGREPGLPVTIDAEVWQHDVAESGAGLTSTLSVRFRRHLT